VGAASQAAAAAAAADEAVAALRSGLQRLQASSRQAQKNLERTRRNLEVCVEGIARAEGEVAAAGDKYTHAQKMRAYMADVCAMLADKSPLVEELEDELGRARAERAAAHARRAAEEDREELEPAAAAVGAAIAALSRGGNAAEGALAADAAAEEAEGRLLRGDHLPAQLDEFGRDLNAQRRAQAAARVRRRAARLAAVAGEFERPPSGALGAAEWREPLLGDDTTDESEGEVADFRSRAGEVFEAAGSVLRDADEEYGSVGAVKGALEGWKAQYPGQYSDAYVGMSAPALFAPFVRLQLLRWAPLDPASGSGAGAGVGGTTPSFDQQEWYRLLFDFGMGGDADPGDADADLVPRLVRSLVLPLGERLLREVWNPYSARQSAAAAAVIEDLLVYVPAGDEGMQRVIRLVQAKLEAAAGAAELPSWPPAALAASRRASAAAARRFGRAVRLLRAAVALRGALPADALRQLAIGKILHGVLLPYVRGAAADPASLAGRAGRVVAALPGEWLQGGVPRGAEALAELLVAVARGMEGRAGDPGARSAGAPAASQLARVLERLGDEASARRLAMMYGVQLEPC
jgi:GC-rich sequence DNA-binding factor